MINVRKTILFSIVLLLIDIPWISFVMKPLYKNVFPIKLNHIAALIAYLSMVITYPFFIQPQKSLYKKIINSIILGIAIYGTYGFTLAAVYEKYPMKIALTETIWGMTLFTLTTLITNIYQ